MATASYPPPFASSQSWPGAQPTLQAYGQAAPAYPPVASQQQPQLPSYGSAPVPAPGADVDSWSPCAAAFLPSPQSQRPVQQGAYQPQLGPVCPPAISAPCPPPCSPPAQRYPVAAAAAESGAGYQPQMGPTCPQPCPPNSGFWSQEVRNQQPPVQPGPRQPLAGASFTSGPGPSFSPLAGPSFTSIPSGPAYPTVQPSGGSYSGAFYPSSCPYPSVPPAMDQPGAGSFSAPPPPPGYPRVGAQQQPLPAEEPGPLQAGATGGPAAMPDFYYPGRPDEQEGKFKLSELKRKDVAKAAAKLAGIVGKMAFG